MRTLRSGHGLVTPNVDAPMVVWFTQRGRQPTTVEDARRGLLIATGAQNRMHAFSDCLTGSSGLLADRTTAKDPSAKHLHLRLHMTSQTLLPPTRAATVGKPGVVRLVFARRAPQARHLRPPGNAPDPHELTRIGRRSGLTCCAG
jgi:hypothetical protein